MGAKVVEWFYVCPSRRTMIEKLQLKSLLHGIVERTVSHRSLGGPRNRAKLRSCPEQCFENTYGVRTANVIPVRKQEIAARLGLDVQLLLVLASKW